MQAYKYTAIIDANGRLVLEEPLTLPAGQILEIVIWISSAPMLHPAPPSSLHPEPIARRTVHCDIPILKEWLEQTIPPAEVEAEPAKWEYLRSKHGL